MLESIVGFVAKVAFWAFVVGVGLGIYLGVRYAPEPPASGGDVCVRRSGAGTTAEPPTLRLGLSLVMALARTPCPHV